MGNRFFRCSSFLGLYTFFFFGNILSNIYYNPSTKCLTPLSLAFILWNFQNLQFLTMIQKLMEDPQIIRNIHPIIPILGCSTDLVSAVWWNSDEELSLHSHRNLLEVFRVKCLETLRIHFSSSQPRPGFFKSLLGKKWRSIKDNLHNNMARINLDIKTLT